MDSSRFVNLYWRARIMAFIKLRIKRLPETEEYKVTWTQDGKLSEAKSYYTTDRKDAELTLIDMAQRARGRGHTVDARSVP